MLSQSLILASASPRRRALLDRCGVTFTVVVSAIDESVADGEDPADYVLRLARAKAEAVHRRHPQSFVLGSDTTVVVDGRILGKPSGPVEARDMLSRLSGRSHEVMSAVALLSPDGSRAERLSVTEVEFALLPEAWIDAYVATGDGLDKAGAYGIQNEAGVWIRRLSGSYSGVVGLPLFETAELLREAGLIRF
ncbi:MAG: Maf family protein [Wenzhouxiangella sp.]|nr:Maf family protein [Wenzhouxiangella sp.]